MIQTWKHLEGINQLDEIDKSSATKTAVIFKHSTTCGISLHAKDKLESKWDLDAKQLDFYYLDLLSYRNISAEVANRYGVVHQSPQIVVIRNAKSVYDISHNGIDLQTLKAKL
jgi:bacillithiol system protein YtxJ